MLRANRHVIGDPRVNASLNRIWNHLLEAPSLNEAAEGAGLSPFHFHRLFRSAVGEAYRAHVQRLRVERGAMWLKFGATDTTQAAFSSGFASREGFVRAFRRHFGEPPSVWQARTGRIIERADGRPPGEVCGPVVFEECAPMRLIFCRHVGPYANALEAWSVVNRWAARQGLPPHAPRIGISYDDPWITRRPLLRYDACIADETAEPDDPRLSVQVLPGRMHAVLRFRGRLWRENAVWDWYSHGWLPRSGRQLGDLRLFSVYRFPIPTSLAGLARRLTRPYDAELYIPVAPNAAYECPRVAAPGPVSGDTPKG